MTSESYHEVVGSFPGMAVNPEGVILWKATRYLLSRTFNIRNTVFYFFLRTEDICIVAWTWDFETTGAQVREDAVGG